MSDGMRYQTTIPGRGRSRLFHGQVLIPPAEPSRHVDFLADIRGRRAEEAAEIAMAEQIARERRHAIAVLSARALAEPT